MAEIKEFRTKVKEALLALSEVAGAWDKSEKDIMAFRSSRNAEEQAVEGLQKRKDDLQKSVNELINQRKKMEDDNKSYQEKQGKGIASERDEASRLMREAKEDKAEMIRLRERFESEVLEFEKRKADFDNRSKKAAELMGAR